MDKLTCYCYRDPVQQTPEAAKAWKEGESCLVTCIFRHRMSMNCPLRRSSNLHVTRRWLYIERKADFSCKPAHCIPTVGHSQTMSDPTASDSSPVVLTTGVGPQIVHVTAPVQKCYMVVTPSVINSNGTRDHVSPSSLLLPVSPSY